MRQKLTSYRFCLDPFQSPTYENLSRHLQAQAWHLRRFNCRTHFNEQNFQFNSAAAECLEFKHLLAQLITHYCPNIMPMTFCINDQNWPTVLNQLINKFNQDNLMWILKPSTLNNGQHIKIFQQLSQVEQHYLSSNRLGGEHVLQHYLTRPHLLKGPEQGHKYSIRMFVVLTNYAGAYLYPQGYFNIALKPYQHNEFFDLRPHLTNEHLSEDKINVVQISTQRYELFTTFYPQIKSIFSQTLSALKQRHPLAFVCAKKRTLAIIGFDFMLDTDERVWLLEANHGPCFPTDPEHALQKNLYHDFWQAFITSFAFPIARKQAVDTIRYELFEAITPGE
jgi:hypothetical protein